MYLHKLSYPQLHRLVERLGSLIWLDADYQGLTDNQLNNIPVKILLDKYKENPEIKQLIGEQNNDTD